ncbi:hypothetical protein T492DRAFT_532218 [Pavlovales sp. CCMP2436]|nr:hypothetical protein T492DRAFT_532218 [Pavlovales sp. CCMP2436]
MPPPPPLAVTATLWIASTAQPGTSASGRQPRKSSGHSGYRKRASTAYGLTWRLASILSDSEPQPGERGNLYDSGSPATGLSSSPAQHLHLSLQLGFIGASAHIPTLSRIARALVTPPMRPQPSQLGPATHAEARPTKPPTQAQSLTKPVAAKPAIGFVISLCSARMQLLPALYRYSGDANHTGGQQTGASAGGQLPGSSASLQSVTVGLRRVGLRLELPAPKSTATTNVEDGGQLRLHVRAHFDGVVANAAGNGGDRRFPGGRGRGGGAGRDSMAAGARSLAWAAEGGLSDSDSDAGSAAGSQDADTDEVNTWREGSGRWLGRVTLAAPDTGNADIGKSHKGRSVPVSLLTLRLEPDAQQRQSGRLLDSSDGESGADESGSEQLRQAGRFPGFESGTDGSGNESGAEESGAAAGEELLAGRRIALVLPALRVKLPAAVLLALLPEMQLLAAFAKLAQTMRASSPDAPSVPGVAPAERPGGAQQYGRVLSKAPPPWRVEIPGIAIALPLGGSAGNGVGDVPRLWLRASVVRLTARVAPLNSKGKRTS